ncbi:hypothetical protein E6H37_03095 [Candidatus Bathyarchaeota archaeon]|nr:MAG: hypothetical protein E6H37_03095 [Candidatus Bathyarchaeota archaeon]
MKEDEVRRYANQDVVGQRLDGLFIEGHVEERVGVLHIVQEDNNEESIRYDQIRWLVRAFRYC